MAALPLKDRLIRSAVHRGVHPRRVGWRHVPRETLAEHFARRGTRAGTWRTIEPAAVESHALPVNVAGRDDLPADRGWWGYSFRDVPERRSGETFLATVPDATVAWYRDERRADDFYPAVVSADGRGLDLREIRFRPRHAEELRTAKPARLDRATWVAERVYHNYSHWLTAHLPKLLLLRELGLLGDVLLPPDRPAFVDDSLRQLGVDPAALRTFDATRPLRVGELTLVGTDRFRPSLLRRMPAAYGADDAPPPTRRIFVSREKAARRKLLNEADLWPTLAAAGFEKVFMEELSFAEQVALMRETAVLAAPHGAGLTNMLFCPAGCRIVEMADPSFPNPNFYATAAALGHDYRIVRAEGMGDCRPLDQDLRADSAALAVVLEQIGGGA